MKTQRRKRQPKAPEISVSLDATTTIFSSDLLTPEEERGLMPIPGEEPAAPRGRTPLPPLPGAA